jgi:hypothetical protein
MVSVDKLAFRRYAESYKVDQEGLRISKQEDAAYYRLTF